MSQKRLNLLVDVLFVVDDDVVVDVLVELVVVLVLDVLVVVANILKIRTQSKISVPQKRLNLLVTVLVVVEVDEVVLVVVDAIIVKQFV